MMENVERLRNNMCDGIESQRNERRCDCANGSRRVEDAVVNGIQGVQGVVADMNVAGWKRDIVHVLKISLLMNLNAYVMRGKKGWNTKLEAMTPM